MTIAAEGPATMSTGRVGPWRISGLLVEAFGSGAPYRKAHRGVVRAVMFVAALLGEWRANASGTAVYFIRPVPLRKRLYTVLLTAAVLCLLAAVVATANSTWWVSLPGLMVLLWLFRPLVRPSLSNRIVQRQLRRSRPPGPAVIVHSVASLERGAGARLLSGLNDEADAKGRVLVLDAANEQVAAKVYRSLGYDVTGEAVPTPWGERRVPMVRYPRQGGEERHGG